MKYLGESFDIHTGGVDNIFPHHENEIAQSEAATGKPFVRYWLHCQHLIVEGEKMSKSKGNFFLLRDLLAEGVDPMAIRYLLLSVHYRQVLNFTRAGLDAATASLRRLKDFLLAVNTAAYREQTSGRVSALVDRARAQFIEALDADLNSSAALAAVFELVRDANIAIREEGLARGEAEKIGAFMADFHSVFGVLAAEQAITDEDVLRLIEERRQARLRRDWKQADEIRQTLLQKGIILEDTPTGTRHKRV